MKRFFKSDENPAEVFLPRVRGCPPTLCFQVVQKLENHELGIVIRSARL